MNPKPNHKRRSPNSERNQVYILAGVMLIAVLAVLGLLLWWTNSPMR